MMRDATSDLCYMMEMAPSSNPAPNPETTPAEEKPSPEFGSIEYWRGEANKLQQLWGTRTFWQSLDRAHRSLNAVLYVWGNTHAATRADEISMQALVSEFTRRECFALRMPENANALAYSA